MSFRTNATGRPEIVRKGGKTLTEVRSTLAQDATAADAKGPIHAGKVGKAAVTLAEDGAGLVFTPDAAFLAEPAVTESVTMAAAAAQPDRCQREAEEACGVHRSGAAGPTMHEASASHRKLTELLGSLVRV